MTNSTIPSFEYAWSFYQELKIDPSKELARQALKSDYLVVRAIGCSQLPVECAIDRGSDFAYYLPKYLLEEAASWTASAARNVVGEPVYTYVAEKGKLLSSAFSEWTVGKSNQQLLQEEIGADGKLYGVASFKGIDIIGATILMTLCARKVEKHALLAGGKFWDLLQGKRIESSLYQSGTEKSALGVKKTRQYTATNAIRDAAMHTAFGIIWGSVGYCAYNGIYNALAAASSNPDLARQRALTIYTVSILANKAFDWLRGSSKQFLKSHGTSSKAPQLCFSQPSIEIKHELVGRHQDTNSSRLLLI